MSPHFDEPMRSCLGALMAKYLKAAIMWLVMRDFISPSLAEYLIQRGGLKHD